MFHLKKHVSLTALFAATCITASCSGEPKNNSHEKVGTVLVMADTTGDGGYEDLIIHAEDDYTVIFSLSLDDVSNDIDHAENYYVVFSGLTLFNCNAITLSQDDRRELRKLKNKQVQAAQATSFSEDGEKNREAFSEGNPITVLVLGELQEVRVIDSETKYSDEEAYHSKVLLNSDTGDYVGFISEDFGQLLQSVKLDQPIDPKITEFASENCRPEPLQ